MSVCISYKNVFVEKSCCIRKKVDIEKRNSSKKCLFSHYWHFKDDNFRTESHACDNCYDVLMTAYELKNIAILNEEGLNFRRILWCITKNVMTRSIKSVLENKGVCKWILV